MYAQVLELTDYETGEPLEFATISSASLNVHTLSNHRGQAQVTAFIAASDIQIRLLGYTSLTVTFAQLQEKNFRIGLKPSSVSLDQISVSAMRWQLNKREIPTKIHSISSRDVLLHAPQTAADMLNISGNVFMQKSQLGGGSPMIRGFSANKLLYVVDGVRMNTAIFRGGNLQNVISIDPFLLESSEIVFGPGSVLYGSDAIGGVMNFKTLSPQFSVDSVSLFSGRADLRYSSANNENTFHLTFKAEMPRWASATIITYSKFDDLRMGRYGPEDYLSRFYVQNIDSVDVVVKNTDPYVMNPTGYSQINMAQKFTFKLGKSATLDYGLIYSATSDYSRFDRLYLTRNGLPRSAEWFYGPQVWLMNYIAFNKTNQTGFYNEMTIRLAHQFFEESRNDRNFNQFILRKRIENVQAYSLNIDFMKITGDKHRFMYGAESVVNDVFSEGEDINIKTHAEVDAASRYPQALWQSHALYANWSYKPLEKLSMNLGARYNYFHILAEFDTTHFPFPFTEANLQFGSVSGNFGILYTPGSKTSVALNIASGFRAPNVDDIGKLFDSAPGVIVVPNANLRSEYVYNGEISVAQMFGEVMKADFSVYYSYLDKALVRRPFTLNGTDTMMYDGVMSKIEAIQNAAFATVYGVQAGVEFQFPYGFQLVSHINYQKGEEELDNGETSPSRHAAPLFGATHLYFTQKIIRTDIYVKYSGAKNFEEMPQEEIDKAYMYTTDADGNPYAPAWYTINFKMLVKTSDKTNLTLGVENIANTLYRPYSSGISAPGRNFSIGLKVVF